MNVLCIWDVPEKLRKYFKDNVPDGINLIYPEVHSESSYVELAKKHKVEMIVGWRPTEELINSSNNLKLLQNPGAGITHLLPLFKNREVKLANCHGNSYFTAQHGVALLLSLSNTIINHDKALRDGLWRKNIGIRENIPLRNNVIGVLGLGHVGQNVAQFLSGFDSKLIACKRSDLDKEYCNVDEVFGYERLNDFFSMSDIVISTLPLTESTEGLININHFKLLGKNGLFINIGRGKTVVEKDLYQALEKNIIAGAALDVFWLEKEPISKDNKTYPYTYPFHNLNNIVLSPHRAASPMSDLKRWDPVIENMVRLKENKSLINLVNVNEGY